MKTIDGVVGVTFISILAFGTGLSSCLAQTIPPGAAPRQYHAKLIMKTSVPASPFIQENAILSVASILDLAPQNVTSCDDLDANTAAERNLLETFGAAKTTALRAVCAMDTNVYTSPQIAAGLALVNTINDGYSYADAILAVNGADPNKPGEALVKAAVNAQPHVEDPLCDAVYDSTAKEFDYSFSHFLPATRTQCGQSAVLAFFNVTKNATFGNTVQYLYNPNQGTNQFASDLVTATLPQGFQVVLAGTATVPTSQGSSQTTQNVGAPAPQTGSDPVAAAVQKLESGGDFNLRFSYPLVSSPPGETAWSTYLQPALGFVLASSTAQTNSAGAQVGYTDTNQYLIYVPIESYFETTSITGDNSNSGISTATLFLDVRYAGEIVSQQFQKTIGVPNRIFQLGQAAAGINFAGSFRIGLQYYFGGPSQAYTLANSAGQSTSVKSSIKGFHVVFTFSPPKKQS